MERAARSVHPRRVASLALTLVALATPVASAQPPAAAATPPPAPPAGDAPRSITGEEQDAQSPLWRDGLLREGLEHDRAGRHEAALDVWARLAEADPTDPAAPVFRVTTLFWLMVYDDEDTRYDERILESCETAIDLAEARLEADADDADAHFLLGLALMNRGRLHGWRGRFYQAGRDGERAREHLEQALALRPGWTDARYPIGLYYFYASLVPKMVTQWLGWLWFVPTGDADTGLAHLEQVADEGDLFREDARFSLANIYTYFVDGRHDDAIRIMEAIAPRYPDNVLVQFELIEAYYEGGRAEEAIAKAEELAARTPQTRREASRIVMAGVWKARAEILRDRPGRALELLAPYLEEPPERPLWGTAWVDLVRGHALDALGRREEAVAQYERVLAYERPHGSRRAERLAEASIEEPFVPLRPTELRAAPQHEQQGKDEQRTKDE